MRFLLVPKSSTLDDLDCRKEATFEAHNKNLNKYKIYTILLNYKPF